MRLILLGRPALYLDELSYATIMFGLESVLVIIILAILEQVLLSANQWDTVRVIEVSTRNSIPISILLQIQLNK